MGVPVEEHIRIFLRPTVAPRLTVVPRPTVVHRLTVAPRPTVAPLLQMPRQACPPWDVSRAIFVEARACLAIKSFKIVTSDLI